MSPVVASERTSLLRSYQSYDEISTEEDSETVSSTSESDDDEEGRKLHYNWGWIIVFASFYCVAVVGGVGYITGVLMESLERELSGNIATISLAGSIQVHNIHLLLNVFFLMKIF